MSTTLRYSSGFKGSNAKYVIRKKIKVHFYEDDGSAKVRTTKSLYISRKQNSISEKNISKGSTTGTINMNSSSGAMRRYVAIG